MAHKLPCIGTHVGGVPDIIVDGETGYLVPPNQPQILADRILRLLRNPDMAREMGERGYRRAMQEFTWDRVVERMQPHLDHLMISQKP
jgi:glycosyltransferase involved in cell wall biosynthesis